MFSFYGKILKQSNKILWKENNFKSPNTSKFNDFHKFDEVISYTETDRNMFLRIDILQTLQGYQVPVSPLWQYRHHSVRFLIVHFSPDKMVNSQIVWSEHFWQVAWQPWMWWWLLLKLCNLGDKCQSVTDHRPGTKSMRVLSVILRSEHPHFLQYTGWWWVEAVSGQAQWPRSPG